MDQATISDLEHGKLEQESEFIATLPRFDPIEGHKWFWRFSQISIQWESQKNRFAFI